MRNAGSILALLLILAAGALTGCGKKETATGPGSAVNQTEEGQKQAVDLENRNSGQR